ncbi:hypothetical protein Afer_0263 [Acidimicrobium ferrooxidans DSM 10331]|uniref:Uncharacterized protein n=1 Tax=Acidimicrobium ferrooxidans (strain DSM 10331 / JCM 15462 / NBRC 103882 / ICP) TaxID=525909 RepID=C7M2I8_ACIFD|nr:hypothetical protein [Acidimicrobium ferrooxidans]ACU53232.1 hypothetical protein Afer_0263 [Acidimicrobium ferrooxidans DSM 10331]
MGDDELVALASALGQARGDAETLASVLADALERWLGTGAVRVQRRGLRTRRIVELAVDIGDRRLVLRPGPPVVAEIVLRSGGVAIAHDRVSLSAWLSALTEALAAQLGTATDDVRALRRALGLDDSVD